MARFIARAKCSRGETHRVGAKARAEASGWDVGGCMVAEPQADVADKITAYITGGSNNRFGSIKIAEFDTNGDLILFDPKGRVVWRGTYRLTE